MGWLNMKREEIILEAKSEKTNFKKAHIDELLKNTAIVGAKYKKHIGLLYNGNTVEIYKDGVFLYKKCLFVLVFPFRHHHPKNIFHNK